MDPSALSADVLADMEARRARFRAPSSRAQPLVPLSEGSVLAIVPARLVLWTLRGGTASA